jgi:hypothetical protein
MRERILAALASAALLTTAGAQDRPSEHADAAAARAPATETFRNYNRTFQLDLPVGWRQIAPGEAARLSEHPTAPPVLMLASPRGYYGVGPVDQWLTGDFSSPWLYVFEQRDEWHVGDDYKETLRRLWREHGEQNSVTHELSDIHTERLGTQRVECIVATRRTTPAAPATPRISLDVHAPTAKQQITLSFAATPGDFARWRPEFERWLETLTFARVAEPAQSLGERLWTPFLVGGIVGLILVLLYRHTRARR